MADISTGRQRGIVPFVDETTGRLPDQYLPQGVIDLQGDLEQAVSDAGVSATAAKASETAAKASADSATQSASAAAQSAESASGDASEAKASADGAASSASAAKASETAAASSAMAAKASETAAKESETAAAQSAQTATEQVSSIGDSVERAAASATAAQQSASQAQSNATAANSSAQAASTSAESAQTAAESAASSKDAAAQSASEASESAQAAETSETNAAASASAAETSKTNAAASASAAKVSETNAAASATAAQNAVDGFGLEVGTTTTGEPGSDAAVEIQKTGTKYTANFTIPRGDKGADGVNENVPLGTASGIVAQASDAYPSLPRKVQVHGRTVENLWPAMSAVENGVTFNTDETGLITISGTEISGDVYLFKTVEGLAAGKTYVGIISATVANLQFRIQGVLPGAGSASVIVRPFTTSGETIQIPAGTTNIQCVLALEGVQGQTVNSSLRVMPVEGDTVPDVFVPSGEHAVEPTKLVLAGKNFLQYTSIDINRAEGKFTLNSEANQPNPMLESGSTLTDWEPFKNIEELNLPSGISLADGDTLTIERDGTTRILHADGEPTVLDNVTLPELPAPTFNVYTTGGYIQPTVDVDYEQDVNLVLQALEAKIAALEVANETN